MNEALLVALLTDEEMDSGTRKAHISATLNKLEGQDAGLGGQSVKSYIHKTLMSETAKAALA